MKSLLTLALMAAIALPALAQEGATPAVPPEKPNLEQMKAEMAKHHEEMKAKQAEKRAAWDKHHDDCNAKAQAAGSVDEMKKVHEQCREEGKAMHEKFQEKRKEHQAMMKDKRMERRAQRGKDKAPAAQ